MGIGHLLNRELTHYRTSGVRTPTGGLATERTRLGAVWARIPQPGADERVMARTGVGPQQGGVDLNHPIYTDPDEDIRRSDELHDANTGEWWRVVAAVVPSVDGVYLRLDCGHEQRAEEVA